MKQKRRNYIKVVIAVALTILIGSMGLVEAAPLNNVQEESTPHTVETDPEPTVVTEEPVQERLVEAKVVSQSPAPKPAVVHPVGCEHYRELYTNVFGSKADVFLQIANKESGCNPMAVGDKHLTYWQNGIQYGMSCGLLQVRYLPGRPSCSQMQDPEANARYALGLYNANGFRPWTVCNKGLVNCY